MDEESKSLPEIQEDSQQTTFLAVDQKVEAVDVTSKNNERNEVFTMSRKHITKDPNENKDYSRPRLPDEQRLHESHSKELHHQRSVRQRT